MTQENKELLLQDLCARFPYGVKISTRIKGNSNFIDSELSGELLDDFIKKDWGIIKPYLRPMSSMTEEEVGEYISLKEDIIGSDGITYFFETYESIDWLNAHHFDYRGLIDKGLAIEVTEENNPYKK